MTDKLIQVVLKITTTFIALTAIGGGIAMLTKVDEFPLEWLENTPFSNYTIPALILAIMVGGSALLAAIALFTRKKTGNLISVFSGLAMMGYILVEFAILKQEPPGPTTIEIFYFILGLIVFGLALFQLRKYSRKV